MNERRTWKRRSTLIEAILTLEPAASSFDLVLLAYLHVPGDQRRAILAKAEAAVADGGTLLLVGHDLTNIGTGAPGPTSPEVLYTPADIVPEPRGSSRSSDGTGDAADEARRRQRGGRDRRAVLARRR